MTLLYDHSRVRYAPVSTFTGGAYSVTFDWKLTGHVQRSPRGGWRYLLIGADSDRDWVTGFETRKDAADHLLSAFSPSAAWLS